jgi:hypothetical protein
MFVADERLGDGVVAGVGPGGSYALHFGARAVSVGIHVGLGVGKAGAFKRHIAVPPALGAPGHIFIVETGDGICIIQVGSTEPGTGHSEQVQIWEIRINSIAFSLEVGWLAVEVHSVARRPWVGSTLGGSHRERGAGSRLSHRPGALGSIPLRERSIERLLLSCLGGIILRIGYYEMRNVRGDEGIPTGSLLKLKVG